MNSESQLNLVVAAITAPKAEAKKAWNKLMGSVNFDQLDPRVFNLLPSLYAKIGKIDGVLEANRIRGVYLYNASINLRREVQLRNLVRSLDKNNIDYRILKGMAISLLSGNIGIRSMGDVDLLIKKRDYLKFLEISREIGMRLLFDIECAGRQHETLDNKINLISFNHLEIDLHFSETSFPSLTLGRMMIEKPHLVYRNGQEYKLPQPFLLAKHICIHGIQQIGAVDKHRSLIDLSLIETFSRSDQEENLRINAANYIKLMSSKVASEQEIFFSRKARWTFFVEKLKQVQRIGTKVRFRKTDFGSILSSFKRNPSPVYLLWIISGRFQVIERVIHKFSNGFLSTPNKETPISMNIPVYIFQKNRTSVIHSFVSPFEVRIKVRTNPSALKHDIYFFSEEFKSHDYEIFCNGQMVGKNIANDLGTLGVSIFSANKSMEISIRNPVHSCVNCQKSFNSLTLRLENGMDPHE
jgi:hypothetical protein